MATDNAPRFLDTAGTEYNLALKRYTGIVLESFRTAVEFWDRTGRITAFQTIESGNSHQFILSSDDPTPEFVTPGEEMLGMDYEFDEGTITIDDILAVHFRVPLDQQILSHFDVLTALGKKTGRSLAIEYDQKLAIIGILAAREAAKTNFHSGGNVVDAAGSHTTVASAYPATSTGADNFRDDVSNLAQLMDEDNVPRQGRILFVPPYIKRVLSNVTNSSIFDRDLSAMTNDLNQRILGVLEGFSVVETNNLPSTNITTGKSKYQGNFTATQVASETHGLPACLALCGAEVAEPAIGVVQARGITTTIKPIEEKLTTFMSAYTFMGADILAPWCAGYIRVTA